MPRQVPGERQAEGSLAGTAVARLEGVDFAYESQAGEPGDGPAVLHGIELRIAQGEHVALVGASGAGKSTIAGLLAGLHEPTRGRVSAPPCTVLLAQETHVFSGTLAEGLRLAAPEAAEAELLDALRLAQADGLLETLPDGLHTALGHGGHPLTAAQAQQVALARLVLAEPDLAILDEATADADSADSGMLDRASFNAIRGRSALVIAHRLSQAAACDRIVVVAAGRIVEEGSHDGLVARGGAYAALWRAWAGRLADGAPDPRE